MMHFGRTLPALVGLWLAAGPTAAAADSLAAMPLALSGTALDASINGRVAAALMTDPGLEGARIEIDTRDGIVILRGSVAASRDTRRAIDIAAGIDGVRRVDNHLEVDSRH